MVDRFLRGPGRPYLRWRQPADHYDSPEATVVTGDSPVRSWLPSLDDVRSVCVGGNGWAHMCEVGRALPPCGDMVY
jgi:hypothetical protein